MKSVSQTPTKTYFLWVLGCQMNKSDAERLEQILQLMGFRPTEQESSADIIGIVSCSVRQTAIDRIWGKLREWKQVKKQRLLLTFLTGCVLPHDRKRLADQFDFFIEMNDLGRLPQIIGQFSGFEILPEHQKSISLQEYEDYFQIQPKYHETFRAFVPIMSGCDKFCTYCAVPYTRGRERSRSVRSVLSEVQGLVQQGCREATILGQNVNSYHPNDPEFFSQNNPYKDFFAALLWELNQIDDLDRIHFTAPHPRDMSDEVIDALTLPKHVNYLHLPMQSGDDEVLRRMNRKYTASEFLALIEKIVHKSPSIALGTDLIVGFSGETEEQFQNTVRLYEQIRYDISYPAMYSPRAGTVADKLWEDDVPRSEKKKRWRILQDLMEKITLEKNQAYRGQVVSVLVDSYDEKTGWCRGNSREYKVTRFCGTQEMVGTVRSVRVKDVYTWILDGEAINL